MRSTEERGNTKMPHSKVTLRRLENASRLFISRDTYISSDADEQTESHGRSDFLRAGTGVGQSKSQTLLYYDDSQLVLPTGHSVAAMELCLFHYFADSTFTGADPFLVNVITEPWDETQTTWRNKPSIGDRIAEFDFGLTRDKECIQFMDSSGVKKLRESYGVIISGGVASSGKNERYFISSKWKSKSKNVELSGTSPVYHPHWVIRTKEEKIENIVNGSITDKDSNSPIQVQESQFSNIMQYLIIVFSALIFIVIVILAYYCWRERREEKDKERRNFDDETKFGSFDEIYSSNDSRLNDLFRASESNSQVSSVTDPQHVLRDKNMSRSHQWKDELRSNGLTDESVDSLTFADYMNWKKKAYAMQLKNEKIDDGNKNSRSKKKLIGGRLSRHKKEYRPSSGPDQSDGSISTNMIESSSDPSLINRVCLKIVNRKECDIDYVAPGVASVVENQCATDGLR